MILPSFNSSQLLSVIWIDPLGKLKCSLTGNNIVDASSLPAIKLGSNEWMQAVDIIKNKDGGKPIGRLETKKSRGIRSIRSIRSILEVKIILIRLVLNIIQMTLILLMRLRITYLI